MGLGSVARVGAVVEGLVLIWTSEVLYSHVDGFVCRFLGYVLWNGYMLVNHTLLNDYAEDLRLGIERNTSTILIMHLNPN